MDWATVGQAALSGGLNALGSWLNASASEKASKKAYKRAKEFAQSGIQWKVADANAAGINPYFALGAPTATYSDSSVGVDPLGSALSAMGQDVSRAALVNQPAPTKVAAAMQGLELERAGLENDYLRAKIAAENRLLTQPGSPVVSPGVIGNIPTSNVNRAQNLENWGGELTGDVGGLMGALGDWWVNEWKVNPYKGDRLGGYGPVMPPAETVRILDLPWGL